MDQSQRGFDKFFTGLVKGLTMASPVIVGLATMWAYSIADSVKAIEINLSKNDATVAALAAKVDANTRDISILREWLIRFETKLDRALEKK